MGFLNTKRTPVSPTAGAHLNNMGGPSYDVRDPISRLRMAAASCFFGEPRYYTDVKDAPRKPVRGAPATVVTAADRKTLRATLDAKSPEEWTGLTPVVLMERTIDEALAANPEATLKVAAALRNEDNIRVTPQVILVRAAHHPKVRGTGLVRQYARQIIKRADEPATGLAYHLSKYGAAAPVPNSLKRAWRDYLQGASEYHLAKYRMASRTVKTVDVVNLVHPKSAAVNKLVKGKLTTTDQTWEAMRSAGKPWEETLDVMGHMALLRNVRNLLQASVPEELFLSKLVKGAADGKQLPFRYMAAFLALEKAGLAKPRTKDAIEECLIASLGALPQFPGRVMSLCDNSGSAWGATTSSMGDMEIARIANLSAVLTAKVADEGFVGVFGDRLSTFEVRKRSSIFDDIAKAEKLAGHGGATIGGATENGIWLFWDQAIRNKEHWDHVFVYSDMQAGHGGLYGSDCTKYSEFIWGEAHNKAYRGGARGTAYIDVPKLVKEYRRKVNPNVQVYLVQVAGYQDTIVPEFYDKCWILGGWSDGILRFAAQMAGLTKPAPEMDVPHQAA